MPNDVSALQRVYHTAAHNVSKEQTGFVAGANTNFDVKQAKEGETVQVPRIGNVQASDYVPGMTTTAGDDTTPSTDDLTITKNRKSHWNLRHNEKASMIAAGTFIEFQRQKAEEAMRTLTNELEVDLAIEAYKNASRGVGASGVNPFASDLDVVADVRQVLDDNGAPGDRCLVVDSTAGASLRKRLAAGYLNGAAARDLVEQGTLLDLHGIRIKESAGVQSHTKGDAASYVTDLGSPLAVGDRTVHLDTGNGDFLAGDLASFAGDTNRYAINTGALGDGDLDIVLGRPGLRSALADGVAVTLQNNYTANVGFARSALAAAVRLPTIEMAPNMRMSIARDQGDGKPGEGSGLAFLMIEIIGDGMTTYRAHLVWGVRAIQSEHICILQG